MSVQLWVGCVFLALLVLFLIHSVVRPSPANHQTRSTVQFLTALCGGFAGGLLTGEALFRMTGSSGGLEYAVSGTAGFSIFLVVWFFYPKAISLDDRIDLSIPDGWTFRTAVDALAKSVDAVVDFQGFTAEELESPLQEREVSARTVAELADKLRLLTVVHNAIRQYDVAESATALRLTVR